MGNTSYNINNIFEFKNNNRININSGPSKIGNISYINTSGFLRAFSFHGFKQKNHFLRFSDNSNFEMNLGANNNQMAFIAVFRASLMFTGFGALKSI